MWSLLIIMTMQKRRKNIFQGISFEEAELSSFEGTVEKNIDALRKNIEYYKNRRLKIIEDIGDLTKKYEKPLTVYLDYLDNNLEIEEALQLGYSTDSVSFYTAWIQGKGQGQDLCRRRELQLCKDRGNRAGRRGKHTGSPGEQSRFSGLLRS